MKKLYLRISILVIALLLPLFITFCLNPLSLLDPDDAKNSGETGSLSIAVGSAAGKAARTVTADIPSIISVWSVSLSRSDGTGAIRTASGPSMNIVVDGLVPGSWNLTASGKNSGGTEILSGSLAGISITRGATTSVSVPVTFVAMDPGSLSLAVSFPASTAIDYASATINGDVLTPPVNILSNPRTVTFADANLPTGTYNLEFTLRRGGAGGTIAGMFVEAVNIYPGITSDRWVAADGSLSAIWNLSAAKLFSSNAYLASLAASSGALVFSSGNFAPSLDTGAVAVAFVPTASIAGQLIEYGTDNATWITVQSGASTHSVAVAGSFYIRVTSPDRVASNTYVVSLSRAYTITYFANNASPMTHGVSVTAGSSHTVLSNTDVGFVSPLQDGITQRFAGWNTNRDGTGSAYAAGALINPVSSNMTLHAQWSVIGAVGPASGYVFYDKGNYSNGWRYLEVYNNSGAEPSAVFYSSSGSNLGTVAAEGAGKKNTELFLAKSVSGIPAACASFSANGFDDWFLPSSNDIERLRVNLYAGCGLGSFMTGGGDYYATSTEADANNVVSENMGTGATANCGKTVTAYYRPIRAFAGTAATRILVYDVNEGTGSVASSGVSFYPSGSVAAVAGGAGLSNGTTIFAGWNTEPLGGGIPYGVDGSTSADDFIALVDDAILYAQWRTPTVQNIIDLVSSGGLFTLPATFTANDIVAIGDAIAASSGPTVQLNLSALTFDTFPAGTFSGCTKLTSVIMPNSVTTIRNNCFSSCTNLTTITLGNAVTLIEVGAFNSCTLLSTISIPATILLIDNNAFANTALVNTGGTLTCAAVAPPVLGNNVFGTSPSSLFFIKVPSGSVSAYQAAAEWSNYATHISGY